MRFAVNKSERDLTAELALHCQAMAELLATDGWAAYQEAMSAYGQSKLNVLRTVDLGQEGRPPDDYLKGYLDALDFALAYPRHVHNTRTIPPG